MAKPDLAKVQQNIINAKDAVAEKVGTIDTADVIAKAVKIPGAKIDRTTYLTKELRKYYPNDIIEKAIESTPFKAGVPEEGINAIAKAAINYETSKVSAISAAAGIPGGLVGFATIPADTVQYFVFMIRIAQKLAYLYGYPEMEFSEDFLDDASMNELLLFLGVMFGVQEANLVLKGITEAIAQSLPKKLMKKALTKGTIYPIVKSISKKIGVNMTKEIFANGVGKAVPVIGGVVSGGLTLVTFKPCSYRLKKELEKALNTVDTQAIPLVDE